MSFKSQSVQKHQAFKGLHPSHSIFVLPASYSPQIATTLPTSCQPLTFLMGAKFSFRECSSNAFFSRSALINLLPSVFCATTKELRGGLGSRRTTALSPCRSRGDIDVPAATHTM